MIGRRTGYFKLRLYYIIILVMIGTVSMLGKSDDDNKYDVKKIPANLKENAGAIVRVRNIRFEVKDERRAVKNVTIAVTIFNKDERDNGVLVLGYDKFREIEDLEGTLYDANGEEIRTLEKSDIKDYSDINGFSLYEDSRQQIAELYHDRYPYTVEFIFEMSFDGFINWPTWFSQTSLDPVEQTQFEVLIPEEDTLRYWCNRDSVLPIVTSSGGRSIYTWKAKHLPQLSKDAYGDNMEDIATVVRIAPKVFTIEKYSGDMLSWKNFGLWFHTLAKGKDKLPESAIKDIQSLIRPDDTVDEKVKKLYRYMQSRTRYVSVQLGIGGWQPFDANYVHEHGYGDCKALSNYMVALLGKAGVPAYSVLIENGSNPDSLLPAFPANQFNHVIVCVPMTNDSLWLECTSQSMPMGHIGKTNEHRQALLIKPEGGVVVNTPASTPEENRQKRIVIAEFHPNGEAKAKVNVLWSSNQQDYVRGAIENSSPKDCEKWVTNSIDIPNMNLQKFSFEGIETHSPEITLHMELILPRYASVSGTRMFFQPNMMERRTYVPPVLSNRMSPVRFSFPYNDSDSIYYSIPKGYSSESLPSDVQLKTSFASYRSSTRSFGDSVIVFCRELRVDQYSIPATFYSEYQKFFSSVVKADRAQVVLIKK